MTRLSREEVPWMRSLGCPAHIGGFIFGAVTARLFEDPRRIAWQEDAR